MVEREHRTPIESGERGNPIPQWELFIRQAEGEPLCHVGSVAATSGPEAHEHASRLFGRDAVDIWCCPASEVERYTASGLAAEVTDRGETALGDCECEEAIADGEPGPHADGETPGVREP